MTLEIEAYVYNRLFQAGRWYELSGLETYEGQALKGYDAGLFIEGFCPACRQELERPGECTECNDTPDASWLAIVRPYPSCPDHGHMRIAEASMPASGGITISIDPTLAQGSRPLRGNIGDLR